MHEYEIKAIQYIRNTAGNASLDQFHEDHEPIGPDLWSELNKEGMAHVVAGKVLLTDKGNAELDAVLAR